MGCPSTLGASKKASSEYFQRVAVRDPLVRALFPQKVISDIENETGCKITVNEKFLFVSAKEPSFLSKGIGRVHDMIQTTKEKSTNGSPRAWSRSPSSRARVSSPKGRGLSPGGRDRSPSRRGPSPTGRDKIPSRRGPSPRGRDKSPSRRGLSPAGRGPSPRGRGSSPRSRDRSPRGRGGSPRRSYSPRRERSGSQKLHSPRNDRLKSHGGRSFGDRAHEDSSQVQRGSPQDYPKYGGPSTQGRSRSPMRHSQYPSDAYNRQYGGQNRNNDAPHPAQKVSGWDVGGQQRVDAGPGRDPRAEYLRTMEELEMEFNRETMEMRRAHDQEKLRVMRENYTSDLATLRSIHSKQWDNFLQHSSARQPSSHLQPLQGPYPPPNAYTDLPESRNNSQHLGSSSLSPMGGGGPQNMFPYGMDSTNAYSAAPRPHDGYGSAAPRPRDGYGNAAPRPRDGYGNTAPRPRDGYGNAYGRY